ncbi:MAG: hypothetical protein AB1813_04685, partial [Verrucomicrobiota bacterium]
IYRGNNFSNLTLITNSTASTRAYPITVKATNGVEHAIAVSTSPHYAATEFNLRHEFVTSNDRFAGRRKLEGASTSISGWTFQSTRDFREPFHDGEFGGRSVWYSWTAPATGQTELHLATSMTNALLAIYRGGEITALVPVASSRISKQGGITFHATAGTEYAIAIDGRNAEVGEFSLTLQMTELPTVSLVVERITADGVQLRVNDLRGRSGFVEFSDDLILWSPGRAFESGLETFRWIDTPEPLPVFRFYRAVVP